MSQPQTITLNTRNSLDILYQYIDIGQKNGVFDLAEADILKRSKDVLFRGADDKEIPVKTAKNLSIQACNKIQKTGGCFTIDDASIIHKVIQYVNATIDDPVALAPAQVPVPAPAPTLPQPVEDLSDLSELSEAVPLRSGPRVV